MIVIPLRLITTRQLIVVFFEILEPLNRFRRRSSLCLLITTPDSALFTVKGSNLLLTHLVNGSNLLLIVLL